MSFAQSSLWRSTLSQLEQDDNEDARALLRNAYFDLRKMATRLVENIAADLRSYTVHDISHLDALWGIASEIAGTEYALTPTEAFVLGGAILLHDAGMCLAAYPDGISEIKKHKLWPLVLRRHAKNVGVPTEAEEHAVLMEFLRLEHANRANDLCRLEWKTTDDVSYFLIEKSELRQKFGQFIGEIAASHWWSHEKLAQNLNRVIAAPPPFPTEWHIDLLKIASILRVADAAHIDERRAPGFVWALRSAELVEESKRHWLFQNRLSQPERRGDAIHFSSTSDFHVSEAEAWWLAYDTLRMIDEELHRTDVLLADLRGESHRLSARRVANVESPTTMVTSIRVAGWIPVDTAIRVSDVPAVIRMLGGEALYGRNSLVPVRELVQNAADAIRLKSAIEPSTAALSRINITVGKENGTHFLEVSDNGIGMSKEIITKSFLDFGGSGWREDPAFFDHPEVDPNSVRTIGKFGIGFFSVFMLGERVEVRSRRYDKGYEETLVLSFPGGVYRRPILRAAIPEERLPQGGTVVRIWLNSSPYSLNGFLHGEEKRSLRQVLGRLFPNLDVGIVVCERGKREEVLEFCDWLTVSGEKLLARINGTPSVPNWIRPYCRNARPLRDARGKTVGRMFVGPNAGTKKNEIRQIQGVLVTNGIAVGDMRGFYGILEGNVARAARDVAVPQVEFDELRDWTSEQADLISKLGVSSEEQEECASFIRAVGGDTGDLKLCETTSGWLSQHELPAFLAQHQQVILLHDAAVSLLRRAYPRLTLNSNVIWVSQSRPSIFNNTVRPGSHDFWEFDYLMRFSGWWRDLNAFMIGGLISELIGQYYRLSRTQIREYESSIRNGRDIYSARYAIGNDEHGKNLYLRGKKYRQGMSQKDFDLIKRETLSDEPDSLGDLQ
jgi:hypothetical protein